MSERSALLSWATMSAIICCATVLPTLQDAKECQVYWYWHIMLLFFKRARVQSGRAVAVQ